MPIVKDWELLPNSDFDDRTNWRSLADNRFAAFRARLLIVRENGKQSQFGPVIAAHNVGPDDEITLKRKREQIISRTETISEAVRFAATARICDQLTAKLTSELSAKVPGFTGRVQSELLTKNEYEVTEQVEYSLNATTSHLIQEIEATEHIIKLKGRSNQREAQLRRRFWPRRWDVYLHSFEYLELSYRTNWVWWQVRETIKQLYSGVLGWPLVSLTFYEPQSDVDVCYGPVEDEIEVPELVEVSSLNRPMPASRPPVEEDLETLAKVAFPVTKQEKTTAAKRKKKAALKAKAVPKKRVMKKAALKKKAVPKKRVMKKAVKRKR